MPTDTPDPNRYCPECERWRSPAPYCPECKCKTRDATEQELTGAEIPDGSLAFGRHVVEGVNVYEVLQAGDKWAAGDQTQWKDQRDGDVWESFSADGVDLGWTITRGEAAQLSIRRPLPRTPATYALLQAAWVDHFRVKVGTRVRISREWSEKGDLSFIHPHYEMLNMVGSEQFVKEIDPGGVKLEDWWFPFHVLTVLPEVSQPAEARDVAAAEMTPLTQDQERIVREGEQMLIRIIADRNKDLSLASAELAALRTANAALAETVAGMREAVNDELAEAVALLETICGQEIQKQAGLDPGGRSTLELAEEAIALIAEKQRREGGSDG